MKKLIITIAFFSLILSMLVHAYTVPTPTNFESQPASERTWKYIDKSTAAIGSFLIAKEGRIFIEQNDHIVNFPIEELSWVDQKFVSNVLKELEAQDARLILPRPQYAQILLGPDKLIALSLLFLALGVGISSGTRFNHQNA